jgi:hypothetical protein
MHQKYCLSAFTTLAARVAAGLRAHKRLEIAPDTVAPMPHFFLRRPVIVLSTVSDTISLIDGNWCPFGLPKMGSFRQSAGLPIVFFWRSP